MIEKNNEFYTEAEFNELPISVFKGSHMPIYLEPIIGSGERITIIIVGQNEDNTQLKIVKVLSSEQIKVMFSKSNCYRSIEGFINLTEDSIKLQLVENIPLEELIVPLQGIIFGKVEQTYSGGGIDGVVTQGITWHSGLYNEELLGQ